MECVVCGIELPKDEWENEYSTCKTCYGFLQIKHKDSIKDCLDAHKQNGRTYTVLDLFAGCGGLSCGFENAGYEIIGFVEQSQPAIDTFLMNHPDATLLGEDISSISTKEIEKYSGAIDIIVGGPPCQGFSLCGKRNPQDARNTLYKEFVRFVDVIKPKLVVMENVPGLLTMKDHEGQKVIDKILHDFTALGYSVTYKVLTASDYGVAQQRNRLVIIAEQQEYFPKPTQYKPKSVSEMLADLPEPESGLNGHVLFETKKETLDKIRKLKPGEKLSKSFNFCRQRLCGDKPSKTVTTKPMFIHPTDDRFLTPRELARLQSFPDSFEFCGTKNEMVKQIGNAVPPLMAQALANQLKGVVAHA